MLLADRNPRLVWHQPPSPDEANPRPPILVVELDCPCGYHAEPFRIMPAMLSGIPVKMPDEPPNHGWWTSLLNGYSWPGDYVRILPGIGCRMACTIQGGRVRNFDGSNYAERKDVSPKEALNLISAREAARKEGKEPPTKEVKEAKADRVR